MILQLNRPKLITVLGRYSAEHPNDWTTQSTVKFPRHRINKSSEAGDAVLAFDCGRRNAPAIQRYCLQAHVAGGVAPVAVAGAAADGADLNDVTGAGGQAVERQRAGTGDQAAALPWADRTVGANRSIPEFIALGVGDGLAELHQQLAGMAVAKAQDEWRGQRRLGMAGLDCREPAGEQCGEIAGAVVLDRTLIDQAALSNATETRSPKGFKISWSVSNVGLPCFERIL